MKTNADRHKLIDETVEHYTHHPRCIQKNTGYCVYWCEENPDGCAIGRLLDLEIRKNLSKAFVQTMSGICNQSVFRSLPKEVQGYGQQFLSELQGLHDSQRFWIKNENGTNDLTEDGHSYLEDLKKKYPIEKCLA